MQKADNEHKIMSDDLSLKDLLFLIRGYIRESLKYWWVIALSILIFAAASTIKYFVSDPEYKARLTCIVNEEVVQESEYPITVNLAQVVELSKSRKILESVFFEKGDIGGTTDFYANHIIELYELDNKLAKKNPAFAGFKFTHNNFDQFTRADNAMLLNIYNLYVDPEFKTHDPLLDNSYYDKTGIISFNLATLSEELTIGCLISLHKNLNIYFSEIADQYFEKIFTTSKSFADSTFAALKEAEFELAEYVEENPRTTVSKFSLTELRLERNVEILTKQYTDASRNVNEARVKMNNQVDFLEIIDKPISPLKPVTKLKVKRLILMMALGAFLAFCFVASRKLIRDTLNG